MFKMSDKKPRELNGAYAKKISGNWSQPENWSSRVIDRWPVQVVACLSLSDSWDRLQHPPTQEKADKIMDGWFYFYISSKGFVALMRDSVSSD